VADGPGHRSSDVIHCITQVNSLTGDPAEQVNP
jgi:hypothetical protein